MPAKTKINSIKAEESARFLVPSKACRSQRGLYEETGLVLNANNNGVFTKTGANPPRTTEHKTGRDAIDAALANAGDVPRAEKKE